MPKLSPTQLEKISYSGQGWTRVMAENMQKLNDTLLKVSGMLDVELTSLQDNDVLRWDAGEQKFKNAAWTEVFSVMTTTTSTTTTTTA